MEIEYSCQLGKDKKGLLPMPWTMTLTDNYIQYQYQSKTNLFKACFSMKTHTNLSEY